MISRGLYVGGPATLVQPETLTNLPWRFNSGNKLLDVTDPLNPVVIAKGCYAFNLIVQVADAPGPAGANAVGQVNIFDPISLSLAGSFDLAIAGAQLPLTVVWYCPAGTVLNAQAVIRDCPGPKTFALTAGVQRVS